MRKTVFEKIISGELPSEKVWENERILVIKDIAPIAPVHLLIITKKVIPSLQEMKKEDLPLLMEIVEIAQMLATKFSLAKGYRLLTNHGPLSGQTIFHLHFHLIGGRALGSMA
jgi:histidine triad (HIT) family protein